MDDQRSAPPSRRAAPAVHAARQELDARVAREVMGWSVGELKGARGGVLVIYDPSGRRLLGGASMRVSPLTPHPGHPGHPGGASDARTPSAATADLLDVLGAA